MTCGIYFIKSPSGKMYIGSSIRAEKRCIQHFVNLRRGVHPSRRLSMAFVKYKGEGFEHGMLEVCPAEKLEEREQFWIDLLKPRYNARLKADSNTGLRMTEAERLAHSDTMKEHVENNPEFREHLVGLNEANWADPERKAARIASLKAAWTPEKRAAVSAKQKGIDAGVAGRAARWSKPGASEHQTQIINKIWDRRGRKNTPEAIHAKAKEFGWECREIGVPSKPGAADGRITIFCPKHNHTGTPTLAKLMYQGQGCRLCGFERSSEKQKGISVRGRGKDWSSEHKAALSARFKGIDRGKEARLAQKLAREAHLRPLTKS
jgi:group I intron endonuclease